MLANSLQVLSPERARCFNVGSSSPGPLWHNPDSEDDFFGVITFTLKPGGLLFGVQLPPRLPKGASEAERRAHAKREQTAYGQVNAAAIQAKRQLYRSAGTKPWQESRRRA